MERLKNSGLPLWLDDESGIMALLAVLKLDGYSRKPAGKMHGLLARENDFPDNEPFYDVYRGIAYPEHEALFAEHRLRYDITIIMPGADNTECKKTSGHYHGWNPARTNTYAEVYEVIKGTALYILQKSPNFDTADPADLIVDDLILATVHEGETIIIPPDYGHCSVNIGEGPLVFSNVCYEPCPVEYGPVKHFHGMCYYAVRKNGSIEMVKNERYKAMPQLKFATVRQAPELGITFGVPAYRSFIQAPEAFRFLARPDEYVNDIMSLLIYHDELVL